MIEVYKNCKIFYAAPLSKQEDFFVPECAVNDDLTDEEQGDGYGSKINLNSSKSVYMLRTLESS